MLNLPQTKRTMALRRRTSCFKIEVAYLSMCLLTCARKMDAHALNPPRPDARGLSRSVSRGPCHDADKHFGPPKPKLWRPRGP